MMKFITINVSVVMLLFTIISSCISNQPKYDRPTSKINLVKLDAFESDTFNLDNIGLVVIDGIVIDKEKETIQIDSNTVETFLIVKKATIARSTIFCKGISGDLLLISTVK